MDRLLNTSKHLELRTNYRSNHGVKCVCVVADSADNNASSFYPQQGQSCCLNLGVPCQRLASRAGQLELGPV